MKQEYLSNIAVSYVYLHNLHWTVYGVNFKQVHEYLEELYDQFNEYYDEVAERIVMDGDLPLGSMKSYLEKASIEELEVKRYHEKEAIEKAHFLLEEIFAQAKELRTEREEAGDDAWVNMIDDHLAFYNKHLWFTRAMKEG